MKNINEFGLRYINPDDGIFYRWVLGLVTDSDLSETEKMQIDVAYYTTSIIMPEEEVKKIVEIFWDFDKITRDVVINSLSEVYFTSPQVVCSRIICLSNNKKDEKELERKLCI